MKSQKAIITITLMLLFIVSILILFIQSSLIITDYIAPTLLSIFSGSGLLILLYNESKI